MLSMLTRENFAPYLNQIVRINGGSSTLEFQLVECQKLAGSARQISPREPFSLIFLGPCQPILPQRMYTFEFGELGSLEIFIVPIQSDSSGTKYQAIFG
jgi:hypothetical protein